MIGSVERAWFLERQNIGRLFDHAEQLDRAQRIRTDIAEFVRGEIAAKLARMNSAARFGNGPRDLFGLTAARLHHPERDPFGRARADPGHLSKLRDQIPQRGWIFRLSQNAARAYPCLIGISARFSASGSRRRRYNCSGASSSSLGPRAF